MNHLYKFHTLGSVALLGAALLYGISAVTYRFIGLEFGAFYSTLTRNIAMFTMASTIVLAMRHWIPIDRRDFRWFALLGIAGALTNVTFFVALNLLPIGTALFFFYAFATISSFVYGTLFFSERATPLTYGGFVLGVVGLFVLFSETIQHAPIVFILTACLAGILEATWNIFSKKVSSRYSLAQILTVDTAIAAISIFPLVLLTGEKILAPTLTTSWIAVLVSSVTVLLGSYLIIFGYRHIEAHRGSVILLLEVVFGAMLAFLLFNESLSVQAILGGVLIALGATVMNYNNRP